MTRRIATAVLVLLASCTPEVEGHWTGQCITSEDDVRVRLQFYETQTDNPVWLTDVTLHVLDRPDEYLALQCSGPDGDSALVLIDECTGAWSLSEEGPVPQSFSIDATLRNGDPSDTLDGDCVFEEAGGQLELVRTPTP